MNLDILLQTSPAVNAKSASEDRFESGTGLAQTSSQFMCKHSLIVLAQVALHTSFFHQTVQSTKQRYL